MENFLSDQTKSEVSLKNDTFLNFIANQKKV